jgi:hypothetical protein
MTPRTCLFGRIEIMAHDTHEHVDPVSGTTTTGHEWDGIAELNTPLPRWWLWTFYATIVWALAYMIAYPAWPLVSSYTQGLLGWHSREAIVADLDALKAQRATMTAKLAETPLEEVSAIRSCSPLQGHRARPHSATTALRATARAAVAPRAIRTSMTTTGSGAARSTISSRPCAMASVPPTSRPVRE